MGIIVITFRVSFESTSSGMGATLTTSASVPPSINSKQMDIEPSCDVCGWVKKENLCAYLK